MPYTKPKVHNLLQRRQKRTEPQPQATSTKIGEIRPYGFERTDRRTDRHTHRNTSHPPGSEVIIHAHFDYVIA